jgi:hypothetical protein
VFYSQPRFIRDLFVAGGCAYFKDSSIDTDSYGKKIFQGSPITESIKESFVIPINIEGVSLFFCEHLKSEDYFDKFGFPKKIERNLSFLCQALARQFAHFIENAPNEADNIVLVEYEKLLDNSARAVSITKTLGKSKDFNSIFTPVPHGENLSTINESQLHLFHLNPVNGNFQFDALESFLVKNIASYVHNRMAISQYECDDDIATMVAKAFGAFQKAKDIDEAWLDNELGNILIYAFLEEVLEAPKLYNKIELLASGHSQSALSGGGAHLFKAGSDSSPHFQLVFSKSNIHNDITAAIDMAITATKEVIEGMKKELLFIENSILATNFPEHTANLLANILVPKKAKGNQAQNAFGVFLGYSLNLPGVPNDTFRAVLATKMQTDISVHAKYISNKIAAEGLDNCSFYFYFLPFNNAEREKKTVMQNILRGGS